MSSLKLASVAIAARLVGCSTQPEPESVALLVPVTVHLEGPHASILETPSHGSFPCTPFLLRDDEYAMRFTLRELGPHTLTILSSPSVTRIFSVSSGVSDYLIQPTMGFLRVGPNRQHFVDSTNRTVIMRGFNIAWPNPNPGLANVTGYYAHFFQEMQAVGANYARIWLAPNLINPWNPLALLSSWNSVNLKVAAVVDDLLALAQQYGIRLMLVLESFNALCPAAANAECRYNQSVYSKENGGPLPIVGGFLKFWSDTAMIGAWESYVKYVVARFAPHPSLFAIQLFNEVDACMFDVVEAAYAWHEHMASIVHVADNYGHLVSESFGINIGNPFIDKMPGFDITTTHAYARHDRGDSPNAGMAAANWTATKLEAYRKPSFVGEYGCDDDAGQALTEQAMHDGVWAPLFAGAAATGAFWYWDTLPVQFWASNLGAVDVFLKQLPFELGDRMWRPLDMANGMGLPESVEAVGIASVDRTRLLLFLHSRNGSEPCIRPATEVIPSFELRLPASSVVSVKILTWYDSSTGLPLASVSVRSTGHLPATPTAVSTFVASAIAVSTPEFVSDAILVGSS